MQKVLTTYAEVDTTQEIPLVDQNYLTPEEEQQLIRRQQEIGMSATEELFCVDYELDTISDFPQITTHPAEANRVIDGLTIREGIFVTDVEDFNAVIDSAKGPQEYSYRDPRGTLTSVLQFIKHGFPIAIDRMSEFVDLNRLYGEFDLARSEIKYAYSSKTEEGEIRDAEKLHVHTEQTDRFIFYEGHWDLVFIDTRKNSPTFGKAVYLHFEASQEKQVAIVVPPGIAHSVAHFRHGDETQTTRLLNCPTRYYGEQPSSVSDITPQQVNTFREGRIPTSRVAVIDANGQEKAFSWMAYSRWIRNCEKLGNLSCHAIITGHTGRIGHAVAQAMEHSGMVYEAVARTLPEKQSTEISFTFDLVNASVEEIRDWIKAARPARVLHCMADTNNRALVLATLLKDRNEIFGKYLADPDSPLPDPITQANTVVTQKLVNAISQIDEAERPVLVYLDTTYTDIPSLIESWQSYYAYSKAQARRIIEMAVRDGRIKARRIDFGYPYPDPAYQDGETNRAKSSTLSTLIGNIRRVVMEYLETGSIKKKVPVFTDDLVDHSRMSQIVQAILSGNPAMIRRGWMSTAAVAHVIVEEIIKALPKELGLDPHTLYYMACRESSILRHHPTVGEVFKYTPGGPTPDDAIFRWIDAVCKRERLSPEQRDNLVMALPVDYAGSYPHSHRGKIEPEAQGTYLQNLRHDIAQMVTV